MTHPRVIGRWIVLGAVAAVLGAFPAAPATGDGPSDFAGAQVSEYAVTGLEPPVRTLAGLPWARLRLGRVWFRWDELEVSPGVYDFSHYDRLVADAAAGHVQLLPALIAPPSFRSSAPSQPEPGTYPPARPADMAEFAAILVARYGPSGTFWAQRPDLPRVPIRSWQIWNEPNLWPWWAPWPDAEAYTGLLRAVGGGIKRCDPRAEVVAAGLPNSHDWLGPKAGPFVEAMYAAGARGSFDALAIHPYGNPVSQVTGQIEEMRSIMDRHGDGSPIWVTEIGWPDGGPPDDLRVTSSEQAALVSELVDTLHARRQTLGIRGVVYYQWADSPPVDPQFDSTWNHIGLLDRENRAKPALVAMADAVLRAQLDPGTPADARGSGCAATASEIAQTPSDRKSDGTPATQAALVNARVAEQRAGIVAPPAPDPSAPANPPPAAALSPARVRPASFAPVRRGPPVLSPRPCRRRRCPGALLTFTASTDGTVELRYQRTARKRRPPAPLRPVLRLPVHAGAMAFRLTGRLRRRPLPAGPYRVLLQLRTPDGRRSNVVAARLRIAR